MTDRAMDCGSVAVPIADLERVLQQVDWAGDPEDVAAANRLAALNAAAMRPDVYARNTESGSHARRGWLLEIDAAPLFTDIEETAQRWRRDHGEAAVSEVFTRTMECRSHSEDAKRFALPEQLATLLYLAIEDSNWELVGETADELIRQAKRAVAMEQESVSRGLLLNRLVHLEMTIPKPTERQRRAIDALYGLVNTEAKSVGQGGES